MWPGCGGTNVRIRTISFFILGTALLLVSAAPAAAQDADVGVSYSILRQYEVTAPVGFAVDVSKAVGAVGNGTMRVVGEFGMNRFTDEDLIDAETQFSYMGGLRFAAPTSTGGITPFGQFLVGGLSSFDENDFAVQPGGGVAFDLNPNTDVRVQVDFPIDFAESKTFTGFRFNVGVVWAIGQ